MQLPTLRLRSSLRTIMSRRGSSPPPPPSSSNYETNTTITAVPSTTITRPVNPTLTTSISRHSRQPSSTNRDRSPSTSSTKSSFSTRSAIYPIEPPEALVELSWRRRRDEQGDSPILDRGRSRGRYASENIGWNAGFDGCYRGEGPELLEPRPERVYVKGLWETILVEDESLRGRAL